MASDTAPPRTTDERQPAPWRAPIHGFVMHAAGLWGLGYWLGQNHGAVPGLADIAIGGLALAAATLGGMTTVRALRSRPADATPPPPAEAPSETDLTRQELAEARLKLEEVLAAAQLGYWEFRIADGRLTWSARAAEIHSQAADVSTLTFDHFLSLLHPEDRDRYGFMLEAAMENPERAYFDYRVLASDGRTRHVSSSAAPRFDPATGRLTHLFGVYLDMTERAEAETALRLAKERLEEAYRTANLGYWEFGIQTGALSWDKRAFAIHGRDPAGFTPTFDGFLALMHPEDSTRFGLLIEGVMGNASRAYFDYRVLDDEGQVRHISSSCAPRYDAQGRLTHLYGVLIDITERAEAQAALAAAKEHAEQAYAELRETQVSLIEAEKMASLGRLVTGVAHEVNTPVGVSLTAASHLAFLTDELKAQFTAGAITRAKLTQFISDCEEALGLLVANTDRTAKLVQLFKQVAADQSGDERQTFDLRQHLDATLVTLLPQINATGHTLRVEGGEGVTLDSFPGTLGRALTHLVENALLHAYEVGKTGTLTVSVNAQDEDRVTLHIRDDGRGIPPDDLPKVFDPFFTTARGSGCVGLGLHIVYNLVTHTLGGKVSLDSRPGQGTTVTLRLPCRAP